MARVKKNTIIDAPLERVFAYLKDPMSNLEWLPGMMEVTKVSGEGVGARFRWVYKMAGLALEGESTALEFVPNKRFVTESKSGIVSTWNWDFAPNDGGTRIDLTVDYVVPIPVLGKLAEAVVVKQNERVLDTALENIRSRMENAASQKGQETTL
ncbi:MAG: SRPBCC family protein [Anaerolineae bacterium]